MKRNNFSSAAILCLLFLFGCNNLVKRQSVDWPNYLGDKHSSHYAALREIDTNNVEKLRVAWIYHTGDAGTSRHSEIQCNPLIVNGIVYGTSPGLKLFALDAATGLQKWLFDPFSIPNTKIELNANRGVTYWSDGKTQSIFYAAGGFIYNVNAATGLLVNIFGDDGKISLRDGLGRDVSRLYVASTSPGIIFKNLLIIGTRVDEANPAAPGDIRAYNVYSGKIEWVFHTIPRPGEFGNDTWADPNAWEYTGGANNWSGMSLDDQRGVVYVPTGSATFDFYGGLRKGKNLFSNCVLALDAGTGKLIWHYQTVHHDLWDRDLPAPPNLVTIIRDGKRKDAVAQVTKTGFVFLLDRDSGKPLFTVKEKPVPTTSTLIGEEVWPTQPFPELPEPFVKQTFSENDLNDLVADSSQIKIKNQLSQLGSGNMFLPPAESGTVIYPGFDGGAEWGGAAFDKTTGWFYVNANQVPWVLQMIPSKPEDSRGTMTVARMGEVIYSKNCMVCHGRDRKGSGDFPSLVNLDKRLTGSQVAAIIKTGSRRMPSFQQISANQRAALIAFLLGLPDGSRQFVSDSVEMPDAGGKKLRNLMPYRMTGYIKFRTPEGYPAGKPPWGNLTAINLNSGQIEWQLPLGEYPELSRKGIPATGTENYGGPVVTAGGLLFIAATPDKKLRAFNKRSGKLLWETGLPAAGFATPSVYMINGKQYVVIACGGGKLGTSSGDTYVAFALPGN